MPIATITAGRDAIYLQFETAWNAQTPPVPILLYDDKEFDLPDGDIPWAFIMVRHVTGTQETLGEIGGRRFRRKGIVTVQVRTPTGLGLSTNDIFSKIALDAFEGIETAPDQVIFRRARLQEVGNDGAWFLTNVMADFEYDEVK